MLSIATHTINNPIFLAPMAGVSDVPFRQVCQRFGAGLTTSEMLSAKIELWQTPKSLSRLQSVGNSNCPNSFQIVGSEAAQMAKAALQCQILGADIVDINMGCPAKKVCKKAAGSALLRDEHLVAEILTAVVDAVDIPVTLKIRTGWDSEHRNAKTIAKIAEGIGIQALAIHGRTRACRFKGHAEYDTIAEVKQCLSIPVIANGDIDSLDKARFVKDYTGVDAIMVGRAAQGQPWLIQQLLSLYQPSQSGFKKPDFSQKQQCMLDHIQALHLFYGEFTGIRMARKHMSWYLHHLNYGDQAVSQRQSFNHLGSAIQQLAFIKQLSAPSAKGKAA